MCGMREVNRVTMITSLVKGLVLLSFLLDSDVKIINSHRFQREISSILDILMFYMFTTVKQTTSVVCGLK